MAYLLKNQLYHSETQLDELIENSIDNNQLEHVFIIVPTGKLVRYLKNRIVNQYFDKYKKPCGDLNVFTIQSFVQYCYERLIPKGTYRMVSDAYRLALFEEASAKADLRLYSSEKKQLSGALLQRLADLVYGLKEDGITVESIEEDIRLAELNNDETIDTARLKDIAELFKAYQEILGDNLLDFHEQLRMTTNKLGELEDINSVFPDNSMIFVSGFSEFRKPETEFLSIFANNQLPFALNLEYSERNGPLFGNLEDNIKALMNAGFGSYKTFDDKDLDQKKIELSSFVKRWLFIQNRLAPKNPDFSKMVKILEMGTRSEEVKYIAKLVKYLGIVHNIPLHKICILMRHPSKYTNLFREIFSQNLIPMNISDRYDLKTSPITTAVFAILDTLTKHFRREDIHRAISNTYFTFIDQNGKKLDGNNLYNTALQLRIEGGKPRSGKDHWTKKLESELIEAEDRLSKIDSQESEDEIEIIKMKKLINSIQKALRDFKSFTSIIPNKVTGLSPSDFMELVKEDILNKLNVRKNIVDFYKHIEKNKDEFSTIEYIQFQEKAEKDARAYTALLDIMEEMKYVLSDIYPGKKFTLEDITERFKTSVSAKKYQIREKFNHGINITSIEQTRGTPYDVMILCGAVEGEFPMAYSPETFLGKELKETELRHIKSEYMLFYQFLTNNKALLNSKKHKIFITYFKENGDSEVPCSSFIHSLLEITSLEQDNKIYKINEIIRNNMSSNPDTALLDQLNDNPWICSISNENEKLSNYANELLTNSSEDDIDNKKYSNNYQKTKHPVFVYNFINNFKDKNRNQIDLRLLPNDVRDRLEEISGKPFSISVLDSYASCPFKYFMKNVVKLSEKEVYDNTLSPLEWGNLMHKVLYLFYIELQNEEENPGIEIKAHNPELPPIRTVTLDRNRKQYYLDKLYSITKDEIEKYHIENKYFELQISDFYSSSTKMGYLETLLFNEFDKQDKGWIFMPGLFEFTFGRYTNYSGDNKIDNLELSPKLKIRGIIDRVELAKSENGLKCLIVDYKSSFNSVPSNNQIMDGHSFQIPLYMLAIEKILKDYYDLDVELMGGCYYSLKPKYNNEKQTYTYMKSSLIPQTFDLKEFFSRLKQKVELNEVLPNSLSFAENIADNISQGKFPVEPYKDSCKNCDLKPICRIAEKNFSIEIENEEDFNY